MLARLRSRRSFGPMHSESPSPTPPDQTSTSSAGPNRTTHVAQPSDGKSKLLIPLPASRCPLTKGWRRSSSRTVSEPTWRALSRIIRMSKGTWAFNPPCSLEDGVRFAGLVSHLFRTSPGAQTGVCSCHGHLEDREAVVADVRHHHGNRNESFEVQILSRAGEPPTFDLVDGHRHGAHIVVISGWPLTIPSLTIRVNSWKPYHAWRQNISIVANGGRPTHLPLSHHLRFRLARTVSIEIRLLLLLSVPILLLLNSKYLTRFSSRP